MACNLIKKVPRPGILYQRPLTKPRSTRCNNPAHKPWALIPPAGSVVAPRCWARCWGRALHGAGALWHGDGTSWESAPELEAGPQAFCRAVSEDVGRWPMQGRWGMRGNLGIVGVRDFLRKEPRTGDALPKLCKWHFHRGHSCCTWLMLVWNFTENYCMGSSDNAVSR